MKAANKFITVLVAAVMALAGPSAFAETQSPFHEGHYMRYIPIVNVPRNPQAVKTWQTLFKSPDEGDILTSISAAPNDTIYIASKRGKLYRRQDNYVSMILDISTRVNSPNDRGLNGIAVSPDGLYVYVLYVRDRPGQTADVLAERDLRLERISLRNPDAQDVLLTDLPITADTHTAGFLEFGADGELFVGIGDDAHNESDANLLLAISLDSLYGKVLRLDPLTGGGLPTNPYWDGDPYSVRSRIYASGFRNPFSAYYDQPSNKLYVGDVGQTEREEVDIVQPGKSYGWPCMEGTRPNLYAVQCVTHVSEQPYAEYGHYCGGAVTGIAVWREQLLVSDYACQVVYNPITHQNVFTASAPTALTNLSYDDLILNEYVGTTGHFYGQARIYTSQIIPPLLPEPPKPTYAITLTKLATNVVEGLAISQAGVDVSDELHWDGVVHHDQHIHPDFFIGTGRIVTLTRTTHPDGWVELCATMGASSSCIRLD